MNVNAKGCIGQIKVMDDLYSKGFHCFLPFDDYCPVDLIALDPSGRTIRLQVKYRKKLERKGVKQSFYVLKLSSVVNGKTVPIDRSKIDGWAVYLADDDRVEYIPVKALDGQSCKNVRSDVRWDWITSSEGAEVGSSKRLLSAGDPQGSRVRCPHLPPVSRV